MTLGANAMDQSNEQDLGDRAEIRFRVMRALEHNPKMSQRELSRALGVSLGGINYCIKALIEKGAIKVENFRASDSKLRYAYILTPDGIADKARMTKQFLKRKMREHEALQAEIEGLRIELGSEAKSDEN